MSVSSHHHGQQQWYPQCAFKNECHDDNRVDAQRADDLFVSRGMREYNRYYVVHGHMY
jgi:hypothetical protein